MLAGGGIAGAFGENASGAATSAENEALNNDLGSLLHIQSAVGAAQGTLSWLGDAGSAFASAIVNTGKQAILQVFDGLYDVGGPGTLGPQAALNQSLAQNGLVGTAQAIGSNLVSTIQAASQRNQRRSDRSRVVSPWGQCWVG
jgi:hypothetical protein